MQFVVLVGSGCGGVWEGGRRVAGGRPMMQDHLLVMVLAETLTSAESTALTFDFAHTLQLVQILLGFICYQHLILYVSSFCNNVI